jgi:hypothetical protein
MKLVRVKRWWAGVATLMCAAQLHATIFEVTVGTTAFSSPPTLATLAFDLTNGDPGDSSVKIDWDPITSDAQLGDALLNGVPAQSLTDGSVTLIDDGTSFFVEYLQQVTLGTSFTFRFSTVGVAPADPASPDAFSFSLLDAGLASLVTTGASGDLQTILFRYDIGSAGTPQPLPILEPSEGVTVSIVEAAAVPEPGVTVLLLSALMAMFATRLRGVACTGRRRAGPSPGV